MHASNEGNWKTKTFYQGTYLAGSVVTGTQKEQNKLLNLVSFLNSSCICSFIVLNLGIACKIHKKINWIMHFFSLRENIWGGKEEAEKWERNRMYYDRLNKFFLWA